MAFLVYRASDARCGRSQPRFLILALFLGFASEAWPVGAGRVEDDTVVMNKASIRVSDHASERSVRPHLETVELRATRVLRVKPAALVELVERSVESPPKVDEVAKQSGDPQLKATVEGAEQSGIPQPKAKVKVAEQSGKPQPNANVEGAEQSGIPQPKANSEVAEQPGNLQPQPNIKVAENSERTQPTPEVDVAVQSGDPQLKPKDVAVQSGDPQLKPKDELAVESENPEPKPTPQESLKAIQDKDMKGRTTKEHIDSLAAASQHLEQLTGLIGIGQTLGKAEEVDKTSHSLAQGMTRYASNLERVPHMSQSVMNNLYKYHANIDHDISASLKDATLPSMGRELEHYYSKKGGASRIRPVVGDNIRGDSGLPLPPERPELN